MRPNDYYGHYKAFVKALSNDPELTLQQYCTREEVAWRRLYDWMHRHKISLKRLYEAYRDGRCGSVENDETRPAEFCEITPRQESRRTCSVQLHGMPVLNMTRILLPTGVVIELKDCPVSALSDLLGQCMGKEVTDVQS